MPVLSTIVPIFAVVILGWFARKRGFMPQEFLAPANRLVYYLAIPALIFRSVASASFHADFSMPVLVVTLGAATAGYAIAWLIARLTRWPPERIGSFIQCSAHGNHGYIGLPVAFYFLGQSGLVKTSILAGFLMILQNVLSVLALQAYAVDRDAGGRRIVLIGRKVVQNPVIVSALAGVAASLAEVSPPTAVARFLDILSGLAPPLSLLLIGASLSMTVIRSRLKAVLGAISIKLLLLPSIGTLTCLLARIPAADALPGIILLATPTATVTYVMSKEMHGDAQFAVATISGGTLISALTYIFWLSAIG